MSHEIEVVIAELRMTGEYIDESRHPITKSTMFHDWADILQVEIEKSPWRAIESAPKDGRWMLVCAPTWKQAGICYWRETFNSWCDGPFEVKPQPTHWMPLPKLPKATP